MEENTIVLILGGNIGDVSTTLNKASKQLGDQLGSVTKSSSTYKTAPWGDENQNSFLNQAFVFNTQKTPQEALSICLKTEEDFGRVRINDNQWGNRTLDIDILYYNDEIIKESNLIIPHLRIEFRNFVLVPLVEIIPKYVHPILNKTQEQLLDECIDTLSADVL